MRSKIFKIIQYQSWYDWKKQKRKPVPIIHGTGFGILLWMQRLMFLLRAGYIKVFLDDLSAAVLYFDTNIVFNCRCRCDLYCWIGAVWLYGRPFFRSSFLVINTVCIAACTACSFGCNGNGAALLYGGCRKSGFVGQSRTAYGQCEVFLYDRAVWILDLDANIICSCCGRLYCNCCVSIVALGSRPFCSGGFLVINTVSISTGAAGSRCLDGYAAAKSNCLGGKYGVISQSRRFGFLGSNGYSQIACDFCNSVRVRLFY